MNDALIVVAIFGLLYFVLFLNRPDLGFLLLLFVRGFSDAYLASQGRGGAVGIVSVANPNVGLILILVLAGGVFMLSRRVPFLSLPAGNVLVLLFLTGLVAITHAEGKFAGLYAWVRAASVVVVYALAAYLFRTPRLVQRVIDVLALTFIIPAAVGFYQEAHGIGFFEPIGGVIRISGTFVHPGPYGQFLILCFAVFLCQFLAQSGKRKLAALLIVVASGILIVLIHTRAAWAGTLVVLLTVGLLSKRPALIAVPVAAVLIGSMIPSIAVRTADVLSGQGSLADRQDIWQKTYPQWLDATENSDSSVSTLLNRLVGTGPGSFEFLSLGARGEAFAAHNDYLALLVDYGVIGLIAFLSMSVVLLVLAYRTWRGATDKRMAAIPLSFLAVTLAFLVMRITSNIFGATANEVYLWTLAGLTVAVRRMSHERAPAHRPPESRIGEGMAGAWQGIRGNRSLSGT